MARLAEFDVLVIGAGPAGETAAGRCAEGGLTVAIAEDELVGGECSYWGCIPSKTLIRPGDVLEAVRRVPGAASALTGSLDLGSALARRDYMTSSWDDAGQLPWLEERGITLLRGRARLVADRSALVEVGEGEPVQVSARKAVVLATGTRAAQPPIEGLSGPGVWDNRDATAVRDLPRRLLVLGGGPVGCELAQAFRRLGSDEVVVVEGADRLLVREEPFAGEEVATSLRSEGVEVLTGVTMTSVHHSAPRGPITARLADGRMLETDHLLVAVGRRPRTDDLGLDVFGLEPGSYLEVDDRLKVRGVPGDWLYAVGDCNGLALLTHMGKYQARVAADVILGRAARDEASTSGVPRVTFTDPQVCAVGLTESQARDQLPSVRTVCHSLGSVPGAYVLGERIGGTAQLVIDEQTKMLVGATFTGPAVQELLHSATVAVAAHVPVDRLWHAVPSFPTLSEVWLRLLEDYGL